MYKLKVSWRGAKKALANLGRRKLLGRYSLLAIAIGLIALVALSGGAYALFLGGTSGTNPSTSVNLQKGLVGEWKLNGNAKDSTPYSNNGTVNNATPTTGPQGQANGAYSFNGTGSSDITITEKQAIKGTFSVAGWVNPATSTGLCDIVGSRSSANGDSFDMKFYGSLIHGDIGIGNGNSWLTTAADATFSHTAGQWYHIVYVVTPTGYTIYADGAQVGSGTYSGTPLFTDAGQQFAIGNSAAGGSEYCNGSIAQVRIYNRALNPNEVTALYNEAGNGLNIDSAEAGLVGEWKLNGNAKDSTPYSNNGTLVNAPTPTTGPQGQTNGALNFNGTSQYVNVPNNPILDAGTGSMSWSEWFKTTQAGGFLYRKSASCNVNGEITQMTGSGALYSYIVVGGNCTADTTVSLTSPRTYDDGNWHLATTVLNRTADTLSLYVDGMQVATTSAAALSAVSLTNSSPAVIGSSYSAGYFSGSLADVRIYNQALTASQITNLYQAGSSQINLDSGGTNNPAQNINLTQGLVAYYPFNDNAKDATPYSHNGTVNGAVLTTDRFGNANSAYSFSGATGNNIAVASTFGLGAANLTISCWAYVPSTSDHGAFVKIGNDQSPINGYGIGMGSGIFDNNGDTFLILYEDVRWITTGTNIPVGWHMFTLTVNSSGLPSAYMDGSLLGSYSGTPPLAPTSQTFIGGYTSSTPSNRYFNGSVDEVRIYNRALSALEVQALYNEN